jgi:hypothetical protein
MARPVPISPFVDRLSQSFVLSLPTNGRRFWDQKEAAGFEAAPVQL